MSKPNVYEAVKRQDEIRTFTDVVRAVENELGWSASWDDPRPAWKVRSVEISKMKRVIKSLEKRNGRMAGQFTIANLALTVDMLRRERRAVASPTSVLYHVERALEAHADQEAHSDVAVAVQHALAEVEAAALPAAARRAWRDRLVRAQGEARQAQVAAWREFHHGG